MTNENKNKRYYWIKLKDTFFTSDTVDFLMSQKNGANYVVLYQMLCLKTVNTNGNLSRQIGEMIIPFDIEKIQRDCKYFDVDTIRVALELYKKLGLIYEQENGILQISNFDNLVGSETQGAVEKRQQKQEKLKEAREKKQAVKISSERVLLPNGSYQYIDEKRYGGNGLKALNNAGCMCEVCGETENLLIHHLNGYSNELNDLIVLCKKCHGKAHSKNGKEEIEQIAKNRNIQGIEQGIEPFYQENRDKILDIRDKSIDNKNTLKEKYKKEISIIDYWNDKGFSVKHQHTDSMIKIVSKALKTYSEEEIRACIDRYKEVLDDTSYWFNYEWKLDEFLTRKKGIADFTDNGTKWQNYLAEKSRKTARKPTTEYDVYDEF